MYEHKCAKACLFHSTFTPNTSFNDLSINGFQYIKKDSSRISFRIYTLTSAHTHTHTHSQEDFRQKDFFPFIACTHFPLLLTRVTEKLYQSIFSHSQMFFKSVWINILKFSIVFLTLITNYYQSDRPTTHSLVIAMFTCWIGNIKLWILNILATCRLLF